MERTILVVDDEADIADILERTLVFEGYNVVKTTDSTKAMDLIKEHHVAVVISDICMPQVTGIDLLKQVKAYDPLMPVLLITGYVSITNLYQALQLGVSDVFFKPFQSLDEVVEGVRICERRLDRINLILRNFSNKGHSEEASL